MLNCLEIVANSEIVSIYAFWIVLDHMNILNHQPAGPFFDGLHNIEVQMPGSLVALRHSVPADEFQFWVYLKIKIMNDLASTTSYLKVEV